MEKRYRMTVKEWAKRYMEIDATLRPHNRRQRRAMASLLRSVHLRPRRPR